MTVLGAAPDVVRAVVSQYRRRSGVQIDSLTRRDGVKIYYRVPQETDDVTGFFLRKVRELEKYDIALTRTALKESPEHSIYNLGLGAAPSTKSTICSTTVTWPFSILRPSTRPSRTASEKY